MSEPFNRPAELLGRFGVVKLWPALKVAEDEVIARLQNAARGLGLECVVIDHHGDTIDPPHLRMTQADLDFVIHLHFDTPKSYDIFSFVVLWNPLRFYHGFGYRRVSRNLLTHDDFLSCGSPEADDQIRRLIANDPTHTSPQFTLYHSVSEPILEPTLGDRKLFYTGINWERLGKGASRHQAVLDKLDLTGKVRIFGPRVLQGEQVWEGYQSYQGEIPFDGITMMREINRAGIALALSSEAHIEAGLMSSRLFEALAGGAVVICDQNQFAWKHFGDRLLYVNTTLPVDEIVAQILAHVRWVEENPDAALLLARRAQALFQERYRLDLSLRQIYEGFSTRQAELERLGAANEGALPVRLFLLMPKFDAAVLERHIASAKGQKHAECHPVLVTDEVDMRHSAPKIEAAIRASGLTMEIRAIPFFARDPHGNPVRRLGFGSVLAGLIESVGISEDMFCVVAPNEEIYANHIRLLANALSRTPEAGYAYSDLLLRHNNSSGATAFDMHEELNLLTFTTNFPLGYCRFLFRRSALGSFTEVLLPYLDLAAFAGIALYTHGAPSKRASGVVNIQQLFNVGEDDGIRSVKTMTFDARIREEHNIIRDFDPQAFDCAWRTSWLSTLSESAIRPPPVENLEPSTLSLDRLSISNRQIVLAQLVKSLPLPGFIWRILRPLRPWRRRAKTAPTAPPEARP